MTEIQNIMLSLCFGAILGMMIGNLSAIIEFAIQIMKEKYRKHKHKKETTNKAE